MRNDDLRSLTVASAPDNLSQYPGTPTVDVIDPYTADVVAQVAKCGEAEVDQACRIAQGAFTRGLAQADRAAILDSAAQLLVDKRDTFAALITLEVGKAIKDARAEIGRGAETIRFAASQARTLAGELVPADATPTGAGKLAMAVRVPLGVVAAITPFNFPLNTVLHKIAPAVAAGCSVVLKPAHQTPLTALALRELLVEAGLPEDWLTIATDDGTTAGPALVEHEIPKLISFTGSTRVGWGIAAKAYRKRVALELGSNSPVIVERDADVSDAAARITKAAYSTSGQSCISVQRVVVHREIHDEFVQKLAKQADAFTVGDPFDEATDVGPLVLPEATERVLSWITDATEAGGRVASGGESVGPCIRPTVLDGLPQGTQLRTAEAFGPVLAAIAYDTFDEALQIANETDYGLQAGIFTSNLDLALRACRELEFGGVLVNDVPTTRLDQQPYGGVGESGNTREGPAYAVKEMTDVRYVSFQQSSRVQGGA